MRPVVLVRHVATMIRVSITITIEFHLKSMLTSAIFPHLKQPLRDQCDYLHRINVEDEINRM